MTRIKTSQSIQKHLREELGIDIRVFKPGPYIYIVWPHDDSGDLSLKEIKIRKYTNSITEEEFDKIVAEIKQIEHER